MNREIWRHCKMLPWPKAEKILSDIVADETHKAKVYAYKDAFACTFAALRKRYPDMDGQTLHSIAVDAVEYQRGLETPEELIQQIFDDTGFDIRSRVEDQLFEYIPIKPKRKRESRVKLPCRCGCKRREHLYKPGSDTPEGLMCMVCGLTVWGHSEMDVIRRWNEEVKQDGQEDGR